MIVPSRSSRDVYVQLRALIVAGRIAPGTRLVEMECARTMRVSRTPVREAIRRLAHEGLAHVVGAGAKVQIAVAPATTADLIDLFAIIGALEGVAGRGVVKLAARDRRALARELGMINAKFGRLAKAPRRTVQFFETHDSFHATLVERGASPRLEALIEAVRPQVKRYELLYANAVGSDFNASLREHRYVVSAVSSGTAEQLEQAIRHNWSMSAQRLSAGVASSPVSALGDFRNGPSQVSRRLPR